MNKKITMSLIGLGLTACATSVHADELCSYAPSKSYVVNRIASGLGGAGIGALIAMHATGLTVVANGSGSAVIAGASGAVAGSPVVIPVLIAAGIIAAGAGIALELGCMKQNHPEKSEKIIGIAGKAQQATLAVFR